MEILIAWFRTIPLFEIDVSTLIIDVLKLPEEHFTEEGLDMDYGVHLPLIDFDGEPFTLDCLSIYTETAERLGYSSISANDHMVFSKPWLDGPIALASVINKTGSMTLGTTVALPVVRGPVPLAKALVAIDRLSEGRLFVGVGPGSSQRDYETAVFHSRKGGKGSMKRL